MFEVFLIDFFKVEIKLRLLFFELWKYIDNLVI